MDDLLIVGGGFAGLATALFFARRRGRVTLLERDPPPPNGPPDHVFREWKRPGVPQSRQGHLFLACSTAILREEAPDVLDAILKQGATESPLRCASAPGAVLARRLIFEAVLRSAAAAQPGVRLVSGATVIGLRSSARRDGLPVIDGADTLEGSTFHAHTVVVATGRTSKLPQWLSAVSARPLTETSAECGFIYVCRHYRLRPGCSFPSISLPIVASLGYAEIVVFPADNGVFSISIVLGSGDPLVQLLREGTAFDRVLSSVPRSAPWVQAGTPIDEPRAMGRFSNQWRRMADDQGPIALGLALAGDAALSTSPTLGRGVSLALIQARQLSTALTEGADPADFICAHEAWAARQLGPWYESQLAQDAERDCRLSNTALPRGLTSSQRLMGALGELGKEDAVVRDASDRVFHLLMEPAGLLRNRDVLRRLNAYLNSGRVSPAIAEGPCRVEFELLAIG